MQAMLHELRDLVVEDGSERPESEDAERFAAAVEALQRVRREREVALAFSARAEASSNDEGAPSLDEELVSQLEKSLIAAEKAAERLELIAAAERTGEGEVRQDGT